MIYVKVSDKYVFYFTCKIIFYCLCCCYCTPDIGTLNGGGGGGGIRHVLGDRTVSNFKRGEMIGF